MASPLDVHLYVTPRCNLTCPHCYYDALDRGRPPDNLLPLDTIATVLNGLCARFEADISLEGGEPFMRAGLGAMLAELPAETLRCITITTNGTVRLAAPPEVLRRLGGLRVSIDGHTDELQRELRGVELAPVLRTCALMNELGLEFTARMTLWRRNIDELPAIYDWAVANSLTRLSFFEYQSSGRGVGQELLYGCAASQVTRLLDRLVDHPPPTPIRLVTLNLAERRVGEVLDRRDDFAQAGVLVEELPDTPNCTINFDGTVGISPWKVTSKGAPDVFTTVGEPDFLGVVERAADQGRLRDASQCLSRVQLRCEQ
ncbi:MAG TPA: radical SAM protein [Kineosporiaceae bacterium]|nr:radical SAM protein [Kineosporiaceae bacterium]